MSKNALLFLPDISGFTQFIQTTEVEHSQHVISELLEVLISANTQKLILAEVEGDALFYYKEEVPSMEKLLAQVETMFTAFYSHLKLLENNRICPCNACSSASQLELKIIAHTGPLQFIEVQGKRKPFGKHVIEAHRLMKNSVDSDNYVLFSKDLMEEIMLRSNYQSKLFHFNKGSDEYDGQELEYSSSVIDNSNLKLKPFEYAELYDFDRSPDVLLSFDFPISAHSLLEYITNYKFRDEWVDGFEKFEYNEGEVTRVGTEHVCIVNGKHLNFVAITRTPKNEEIIYGELTKNIPFVDESYQFFVISPKTNKSSKLNIELYWESKSFFKRLGVKLIFKHVIKKGIIKAISKLKTWVEKSEGSKLN